MRKTLIKGNGLDRDIMLQRSRTANGAENLPVLIIWPATPVSFNGAAPRTVRKTTPEGPSLQPSASASTEPHRERCGKAYLTGISRANKLVLQRSRTANGAENKDPPVLVARR